MTAKTSPHEVVRRYFELVDRGELERLDEVVDPHFVDHTAPPGSAPGLAGLREFFVRLRAAFPDARAQLEDLVVEGDRAAARFTFEGTQRGEWMGHPAGGRSARMGGIDFFRIADGRIVELWGHEDVLGLMQQIGAWPE